MWECQDEFLLREGGGGGVENVKPGKSILSFFENERIGNSFLE